MNILVVEDDPATAERMQEMIQRLGHRAETCMETRSALRRAGEQSFDLILLDLFLPDGKGHAIIPVLGRICPGVPIAALTGYQSRDLEQKVRALGVIDYLVKPIHRSDLEALIERVASGPPGNGER